LPPPIEPSLTLLTPRPGTYSSSRVTITGKATNLKTVQLYDGKNLLTNALSVDSLGNFVFQTPALADGKHVFKGVDPASGKVSNELEIFIDMTAPETIQVSFDPSGPLPPDTEVKVTIRAPEPLSGANLLLDGVLTPLIPSGDAFVGNLTTPSTPGDYPVDVTVLDLLGNESQHPQTAQIRVLESSQKAEDLSAPSLVSSVSAQSGDLKVTLFWAPASDDFGIKAYRVEYEGIASHQNCSSVKSFSQFNITPDDRVQWYVDGLRDDLRYCFCVKAIDTAGNISPSCFVLEGMTNGFAGTPRAVPRSGSGFILPFLISLFFAGGIFLFFHRRVS